MFNKGLGIFFLRLFVGVRLIYGVWDNILNWASMLEFRQFLAAHHFPFPIVSAVISVYAQFICGLLFIIGWKIRIAAAVMMFNFLVASSVHWQQGFEAMTLALAMFFSSLLFLLEGAGKYSLR